MTGVSDGLLSNAGVHVAVEVLGGLARAKLIGAFETPYPTDR
jgi:hypothetical protein